jgi:hypothetical protein
MRYSLAEPGAAQNAPFRVSVFYLTNSADMRNLTVRSYSISAAARELSVDRNTLYKWIREKHIPPPKELFVSGIRLRIWTEKQMAKLREHKAKSYWGKGLDRRTGKKVNQKGK